MNAHTFYEMCAVDRSPVEEAGFNPYFRQVDSRRAKPEIDGTSFIDCASNDYLSLASDERMKRAMIEAVDRYGSSLCATPAASGYARSHALLEKKLARFVLLDDALVFPSCYQANTALFTALARRDDCILVDHYAHASLVQGIRGVGCKIKPFLHNSPSYLEKMLKTSSGYRQVFVVTESVFSTEGSIAPVAEIVKLCGRYDAIPVIDDSHGIGVVGRGGRGILQHTGRNTFDGIYVASLGKALANSGGMVAGSRACIEALRYRCAGLLYSTAITPVTVAGIDAAVGIIEAEFARRSSIMWSSTQRLAETVRVAGKDPGPCESAIVSVRCGPARRAIDLAHGLYRRGILSTPFVPPSVPPDGSVVRLIPGAKTAEKDVDRLCELVHGALKEQAI